VDSDSRVAPCITVRSSDIVEACYSEHWNLANRAAYRTRTSGSWGTETVVTNGTWAAPNLADSSTAWHYTFGASGIEENNSTISSVVTIEKGLSGAMASVLGVNTKHLFYYLSSGAKICYITNNGSGWSDENTLVSSSGAYPVAEWAYNYENQVSQLKRINVVYNYSNIVYYTYVDFWVPASSSKSAWCRSGWDSTGVLHAYVTGAGDVNPAILYTALQIGNIETGTSSSTSKSAYLNGTGQILTPSSDITVDGWVDEEISTTLYPSLADSSNTTYVWHHGANLGEYFEVALSDPSGSVPDGPMVLWWTAYRKNDQPCSVKCELRQGSTIIATDTRVLIENIESFYKTLTSGERASITDFTDLRIRVVVTGIV
jgi:hypothetical protein